jgi:cytochrome c-type biogenesis protein
MAEMRASGTGGANLSRRRLLSSAFSFVLGFATVFVLLGATASVFGRLLAQYLPTLSIVAGLIIILFGLHFLGAFRVDLFYREIRFRVERAQGGGDARTTSSESTGRLQVERSPGPVGAYVMGLAFAFGWTPCIGPVLAAVLALASREDSVTQGAALLGLYSAGLGVPFLLAAGFAGAFLNVASKLKRQMALIEKAMGVLLVGTGLLFLTGQFSSMSFWLLETFPGLAKLG